MSSLNENSFKLKTILNDPDHLYLAEQLINNIIILKTVTRVLTRPEEKEGKQGSAKNFLSSYEETKYSIQKRRILSKLTSSRFFIRDYLRLSICFSFYSKKNWF